jgi:hypothetical protein
MGVFMLPYHCYHYSIGSAFIVNMLMAITITSRNFYYTPYGGHHINHIDSCVHAIAFRFTIRFSLLPFPTLAAATAAAHRSMHDLHTIENTKANTMFHVIGSSLILIM